MPGWREGFPKGTSPGGKGLETGFGGAVQGDIVCNYLEDVRHKGLTTVGPERIQSLFLLAWAWPPGSGFSVCVCVCVCARGGGGVRRARTSCPTARVEELKPFCGICSAPPTPRATCSVICCSSILSAQGELPLLMTAEWGDLGSGDRGWGTGHPNSGRGLVLLVSTPPACYLSFYPLFWGCFCISEMFSEVPPSPESLWFCVLRCKE